MNCTKTQSLLEALLGDKLDAGLRARVSGHLRECAACHSELMKRQELATCLRELDDYLGDAPGLMIPAGFAARVVARARQESQAVTAVPVHARDWSLRAWLEAFSLPMRAAIVSAVLLALCGGVQAGRMMTELATGAAAQEQDRAEAVLGMAPVERAMMQLLLGAQVEGASLPHQAANVAGDRQ